MKYSQFNTIVSLNDVNYLYNSFDQKFIAIDPLLRELLEAAKNDDIDKMEEIHPTFYKHLIDEGYLVENDVNEVDKVREVVEKVDNNNKTFQLTINPTMNCNFKCWYCYETHIKKSSFSEAMIDKVGKFIERTTNNPELTYFNLAFFGGEPLLYFKRDVIPVIKKFQEECVSNKVDYSVGFTTNGYLVNDEFIQFFKDHGITPSLQITLDGYGEEHDKVRYVTKTKGSYREIVDNVKKLINNGFYVRLRINYTKDNIANTYKIAEEFDDISDEAKDDFLIVDYHRVWQDEGDVENEKILTVVDRNVEQYKLKNLSVIYNSPNNVLDSCYADKRNSAVINYNGDVYKCTARDFTKENRAGYLADDGTVVWENDHLEKRMDVKFKNKPCLTCKLLPICNGGCSQHAFEALESGDEFSEYCIYNGDELAKDDVVITKLKEIIETTEAEHAV